MGRLHGFGVSGSVEALSGDARGLGLGFNVGGTERWGFRVLMRIYGDWGWFAGDRIDSARTPRPKHIKEGSIVGLSFLKGRPRYIVSGLFNGGGPTLATLAQRI